MEDLLLEAENHRLNNELILAIDKYREALFFLNEKEKIEALFAIADIYGELENFEEANKVYNKILNIDSFSSGAWYGLAFTNELIGGDINDSLKAYEKAIELDKTYKEAYYYAATIYGDLNNFKKSIDYLEKVIELDPDDFVAYNDLGSIYENLKDYERSKEYLNKSISINSRYYLPYFNLGVVYKGIGDYDKAIEFYKKSSKYSDTRFNYLNMSAIYIEQGNYKEAIDILTEGINRNPNHILYYNRACSYSKSGDEKNALKDFNKAYELDEIVLEWGVNDPDLKDIIRRKNDNFKI